MADLEQDPRLHYAQQLVALGDGSDLPELTVCCRGREWKVHHVILRMYGYFDWLLDIALQYGHDNWLQLDDDDDPATVHRMLTWLYTSDYDDKPEVPEHAAKDPHGSARFDAPGEDSVTLVSSGSNPANTDGMQPYVARALINIDVYCIAEKYSLGGLQKQASGKCQARPWSTWTLDEITVLVKRLYPPAPRSCKPLCKQLISDCANQGPGLFIKADGTCFIEDVGHFTSDLSQELQIRKCNDAITRLGHQLYASREDRIALEVQLAGALRERDAVLQQIDLTIIAAIDENSCMECGAHFGAYLIPQPYRGLPLALTCKLCHATHISTIGRV